MRGAQIPLQRPQRPLSKKAIALRKAFKSTISDRAAKLLPINRVRPVQDDEVKIHRVVRRL